MPRAPPPTDPAVTDVDMGGDRPSSPSHAAREEQALLNAASDALAWRQELASVALVTRTYGGDSDGIQSSDSARDSLSD